MRLIDADALKDAIRRELMPDDVPRMIASGDVMDVIDAAPAVIRRARWLPVPDYPGEENLPGWDCSKCGAMVGRRSKYCPGCGARMEGTA